MRNLVVRMSLLAIVALLACAVGFFALQPRDADAHGLSQGSVSGSEVLSIQDQTKWPLGALVKWARLDCAWGASCAGVQLTLVTSSPRVVISDVASPSAIQRACGYYNPSYSPDRISLADSCMRNYTAQQRDMLVGHEVGHALGIHHPPCPQYTRSAIMSWTGSCPQPPAQWPLSHDIADYYTNWID